MKNDYEKFEKRIRVFIEQTLDLTKNLPRNQINISIIRQLIRSVTSTGANYHEACEAESSRDFTHKIGIVKKEMRETRYWLRLLYRENNKDKKNIEKLGKESTELIKILYTILKKFNREKS